ncbi:MAG: glutamate-5-semialdehyde dehydrogenase, partial [Ferruginibacter sp.]|nr:glutamate-5-semialdehyde dehydrogenase [Ferruginibacter sp.]
MTAVTNTLTQNFKAVQLASKKLVQVTSEQVNNTLTSLADAAIAHSEEILEANQKDLDRMAADDPKYDRLKLTHQRIQDIANEIRNVALLPTPLGKLLEERTMENGLHISKITVALGVIGIIYEARPNVTFDVFSLCLKSGNACILKGGSDAEFSNKAIVKIIKAVLQQHSLPENCIELLPATREATTELLNAVDYVDVIIPRGSQQLINYVRKESRVPVIETGAGIVHAYFDESGDTQKGKAIINNSKTRRVSVCNALDCLIIHNKRLEDLPELVITMAEQDVLIYADEAAYRALENHYPARLLSKADQTHFGTEFLDYKMAIKTVESKEEAIRHIAEHSSKHSETII